MSKPEFHDVLEYGIEVGEEEAAKLICKLADAQSDAAYWQGLYEGQSVTLAYLKDRLDTLEKRAATVPTVQIPSPE